MTHKNNSYCQYVTSRCTQISVFNYHDLGHQIGSHLAIGSNLRASLYSHILFLSFNAINTENSIQVSSIRCFPIRSSTCILIRRLPSVSLLCSQIDFFSPVTIFTSFSCPASAKTDTRKKSQPSRRGVIPV